MKPMKNLAQYYVDLLVKLGIVRFSILLALALVALAVVVQVGITFFGLPHSLTSVAARIIFTV